MPAILTLLAALALTLLSACGPTVEPLPPDPDAKRDTALPLLIDVVADDSCNPRKGDAIDWRFIVLDKPSLLSIEISFDNPTATANVYLHNAFGQKIDQRTASSASPSVSFDDLEVKAERHYVRVECMTGDSLYSLKATRADIPKADTGPSEAELAALAAQQAEEKKDDDKKKSDRKKKDRDKKKDDKKKDDTKKDPEPDTTTTDTAEPSKPPVVGTIVLITPGEGGYCSIRISGAGKKNGVDSNMTGTLKGTSKKVELSDCTRSSCNGTIKMDPVELDKSSKEVVFTFD